MNFDKIQTELDYYQKFTPVNFAEERTTFFQCFKKNQPYNPLFRYKDRLDVKDYETEKKVVIRAGAGCFQKENTYLLGAIKNIKINDYFSFYQVGPEAEEAVRDDQGLRSIPWLHPGNLCLDIIQFNHRKIQ
jgi:hypothetical protein